MEASTVPVAGNGLGLEGNFGAEFLSDTVEEPSRDPEFITNWRKRESVECNISPEENCRWGKSSLTVDSFAGADLVLPLCGHNLCVSAGDVDAGIHAGLVVGFDNVTAVDATGADTAVVGTLRTGETALGPAVRPAVGAQKSVFLLQAKPNFVLGVGLHQSRSLMSEVELVGGSIGIPGLAHDQDILTQTDGIGVHGNGSDVDVGVVSRRLASG